MNQQNNNAIVKKITMLPQTPGVYFFLNARGAVIYIGKATSLRSRVQSYFRSDFLKGRPEKVGMIEQIADIKVEETDSEIEALILESVLIKKYRPRFNVMLKDDKSYQMIGITKEDFPRIFTMHQIQASKYTKENRDGSRARIEWLGPYTGGWAVKQTLKFLRRIFPYCTCKHRHSRNSCLYYDLGLAPRYCCEPKKIFQARPKTEQTALTLKYRQNIYYIKQILKGQKRGVVRELKNQMKDAAKAEHFEQATRLRDQITKLEQVITHYRVLGNNTEDLLDTIPMPRPDNDLGELKKWLGLPSGYDINRIECYDIANIQGTSATGAMVVATRNHRNEFLTDKNEYRQFRIRMKNTPNDVGMMRETLTRRLRNKTWPMPDLIVVDGGKPQLNAAYKSLEAYGMTGKIPLIALAKREETLYTKIDNEPRLLADFDITTEITLKTLRNEAHRFSRRYHHKLRDKALKSS